MKTLVILTRREGAAAEAFARLARAELVAVWSGLAQGVVRAAHGLVHGAGAVLEMETDTFDAARGYVEALPYVVEDLLQVQYWPLQPFPAFHTLAQPQPQETP